MSFGCASLDEVGDFRLGIGGVERLVDARPPSSPRDRAAHWRWISRPAPSPGRRVPRPGPPAHWHSAQHRARDRRRSARRAIGGADGGALRIGCEHAARSAGRDCRRSCFDEGLHALQRLHDVRLARRIGEPHEALAVGAETVAEDQRHIGLVEQLARQVARLPAGAGDVGEGIEGAARHAAAHALDVVQALHHDVAALLEALAEALDLVHRPGDRGKPRHLRGDTGAGMVDRDELLHIFDQVLRPDAETQPPAGHREGLGPAVEDDGAVAQFREAEEAHEVDAVIDLVAVDLVRQDRDIGMLRQPMRQLGDLLARDDAARRVGGRVDDDEARGRRDQREHFLGIEAEVLLLADGVGHGLGAAGARRIAIGREARIGIEDFGTRPAEHLAGEIEGHLAARHDHHLIARDRHVEAVAHILRHRIAQHRQALRAGVAMRAVAHRLLGGFQNVLRRREVRLADAEVDDRVALGLQRIGAVEHGEGGFFFDGRHGRIDLQHQLTSSIAGSSRWLTLRPPWPVSTARAKISATDSVRLRTATQPLGQFGIVADVLGGIRKCETVAVEIALQRRLHHLAQHAGIAGAVEHHLIEVLPVDLRRARRAEGLRHQRHHAGDEIVGDELRRVARARRPEMPDGGGKAGEQRAGSRAKVSGVGPAQHAEHALFGLFGPAGQRNVGIGDAQCRQLMRQPLRGVGRGGAGIDDDLARRGDAA